MACDAVSLGASGRCGESLEAAPAVHHAVRHAERKRTTARFIGDLMMRLSDAVLRCRPTKLIFPDHPSLLGSLKTRTPRIARTDCRAFRAKEQPSTTPFHDSPPKVYISKRVGAPALQRPPPSGDVKPLAADAGSISGARAAWGLFRCVDLPPTRFPALHCHPDG
jgi:hypothetical protein